MLLSSDESRDEIAPIVRARMPTAQIESERAWRDRQGGGIEPSALDPLRESDRLIAQARRDAAELDEPSALRRLAEAERLLSHALAVPGSSAFYAEVQLQLGVTAAQLGLDGLAEASFARAARLDPRRRLLAGEAPPTVVSLAARVFDRASAAPEGEVRIVTDPIGARVFLDEVERGNAPVIVRARSGVHSLRIEAPGHVAYGVLFELEEGRRPDVSVALTIDPRVSAIARLSTLLRVASPDALVRAAR
ncbi:MAG TPA: PEGA domain-containing protein, partial [Polyangiales bacterium]|nr:PEGA domain-containing protein [Polyangiales bacterium]